MKPGGQRARRRDRREALHAARMAAVGTPKEATQVAFGQIRADIAKLPEENQDAAWKTVTRYLMNARKEITTPFPDPF